MTEHPSGMRKGLANYGDAGFSLFLRKAFIKAMGYSDEALDRPIVGITDTCSGYNACHRNVPDLIEAIKRGVMLAGGLPIPFPIGGRRYVLVNDEDVMRKPDQTPAFLWMVDVTDEARPVPVSSFQVESVRAAHLEGQPVPTMTGCHQPCEKVTGTEIPCAWFANGLRIIDIKDPYCLREVAHFVPCRLCWFQRIFMYPLSLVLLVGAIRKEIAARYYALPLSLIGLAISIYHYLVQVFPSMEGGSCDPLNPCSARYVEVFGFVSIPFMAGAGFTLISVLLLFYVKANEE